MMMLAGYEEMLKKAMKEISEELDDGRIGNEDED